jgi:hypothetical protein
VWLNSNWHKRAPQSWQGKGQVSVGTGRGLGGSVLLVSCSRMSSSSWVRLGLSVCVLCFSYPSPAACHRDRIIGGLAVAGGCGFVFCLKWRVAACLLLLGARLLCVFCLLALVGMLYVATARVEVAGVTCR